MISAICGQILTPKHDSSCLILRRTLFHFACFSCLIYRIHALASCVILLISSALLPRPQTLSHFACYFGSPETSPELCLILRSLTETYPLLAVRLHILSTRRLSSSNPVSFCVWRNDPLSAT